MIFRLMVSGILIVEWQQAILNGAIEGLRHKKKGREKGREGDLIAENQRLRGVIADLGRLHASLGYMRPVVPFEEGKIFFRTKEKTSKELRNGKMKPIHFHELTTVFYFVEQFNE